jgi:hypothetical protein
MGWYRIYVNRITNLLLISSYFAISVTNSDFHSFVSLRYLPLPDCQLPLRILLIDTVFVIILSEIMEYHLFTRNR